MKTIYGDILYMLKHAALFFIFLYILTGCTTKKFYSPQLMEHQHAETYFSKLNNAIPVPAGKKIQINIDEIRVGYLHRNTTHGFFWDKGPRIWETHHYDVLGGRDLWLVVDISQSGKGELLRQKGKRMHSFTNIKGDQESFSFFPLNSTEQLIFDDSVDASYEVKLKLYSVHGVNEKALLLQAADSSIIKTAYTSAKGLIMASGNFLGKEVIDFITKDVESDPLLIEELLIKASADLEFSGTFTLQARKDADPSKKKYALYDIVKSELNSNYDQPANASEALNSSLSSEIKKVRDDIKSDIIDANVVSNTIDITKSNDIRKYKVGYMAIHGEKVNLPSHKMVQELFLAENYLEIAKDLTKSYIKFTVEESKPTNPITFTPSAPILKENESVVIVISVPVESTKVVPLDDNVVKISNKTENGAVFTAIPITGTLLKDIESGKHSNAVDKVKNLLTVTTDVTFLTKDNQSSSIPITVKKDIVKTETPLLKDDIKALSEGETLGLEVKTEKTIAIEPAIENPFCWSSNQDISATCNRTILKIKSDKPGKATIAVINPSTWTYQTITVNIHIPLKIELSNSSYKIGSTVEVKAITGGPFVGNGESSHSNVTAIADGKNVATITIPNDSKLTGKTVTFIFKNANGGQAKAEIKLRSEQAKAETSLK